MNLNSSLSKLMVAVACLVIGALILQMTAFINSSKLKYGKNKFTMSLMGVIFWMFCEVVKFATNNVQVYQFYLTLTFAIVSYVCVFIGFTVYELYSRKKVPTIYVIVGLIPTILTAIFSFVPEFNRFVLYYKGGDLNLFFPSSYQYTYYFYLLEFSIYSVGIAVLYYYNKLGHEIEDYEQNFTVVSFLVTFSILMNSLILRYDIGVTTVIIPFIDALAFLLMYVTDSYFMNSIVKNLLITEIIDSSDSFIIVYDNRRKILFANDNFVRRCTIAIMEDLIGISIDDTESLLMYMEKEVYDSVFKNEKRSTYNIKGKIYKKNSKKALGYKGSEYVTIIDLVDITYEIEYGHRLTNLTNVDSLTKVKNRFAFQNDFNGIDNEDTKKLTCISIDLDNLKITNDVFGHNRGDEIIVLLADLLKDFFEKDSIYRIGGDEFLIIYIGEDDNVKMLIDKLFEKVRKHNSESSLRLSFSIGCASYCELLLTKEDILKYSDITMYESKENGKFVVTYFSEEIYKRQLKKEKMQDDFIRGINEDEIIIYVQPKFNMKTKKIDGGEALVRWEHKDLGLIPPSKFLDIATTLKLISEIDFKVLEKSCMFIKELKDNYNIDFYLSVNLSLETLIKPSVIHDIVTIIKKYEISTEQITFEILEDKMIQNFNIHQIVIARLKELGFLFAIDDFGSNFSNFDTIKNLYVDEIKIDKSLTDKIVVDDRFALDIRLICELIKKHDCIVTIEGLETKEQLDILKDLDIDYIQGYYFSKPLPTKELIEKTINKEFLLK